MSSKHYDSKRQMYNDLNVSNHTMDAWIKQPWFPRKTKWGWNKADVLAAVEKYNQAKQARMGSGSARDQKLRLECEKLEVVIAREREALKLAELDTAQREGRLVPAKDVEDYWNRKAQDIRGVVENWRGHHSAKHPKLTGEIDEMADGLIDAIRGVFE